MPKRSNTYGGKHGKEIWKELEKACYRHETSRVFTDWLDMALNAYLSLTDNMGPGIFSKLATNSLTGKYEERYLEIAGRYSKGEPGKRSIDYMNNAWVLLVKKTEEVQEDVLGEIYMDRITFGESGQFFTPSALCELMAQIVMGDDAPENPSINDCACGSGGTLIKAGMKSPGSILYGQDVDRRCCMMTVLNMYLFDFNSEITQGDTLMMTVDRVLATKKGGWMWELSGDELKERQERALEPIRESEPKKPDKAVQLNLF